MNGDAVGGLLVAGHANQLRLSCALGDERYRALTSGVWGCQDQGVPLRRKTIEAMADDVMASGGQPEGGRRGRRVRGRGRGTLDGQSGVDRGAGAGIGSGGPERRRDDGGV
eukprot:1902604-Rhodomonas_salina.1